MKVSAARKVAVGLLGLAVLLPNGDAGADQASSGNIIRTWNEVSFNTVRVKNASDAAAARLYAMVDVAMYDAVNGIASRHGGNDRKHALIPPQGAPAQGDPVAAAAAAAHVVLVGLYPDQSAVFDAQLTADLAVLHPPSRVTAGQAWGAHVGAAVLAARANDGSSPNETQPVGSEPGVFRAAWSGVQNRNLAPFAIVSSPLRAGDLLHPLVPVRLSEEAPEDPSG